MRRTMVSPSTSASACNDIKSKDFLSEESEIYDDIERDEVEEIEKGNATQTRSVHLWRVIATLGLSITGICVTGWSYMKLREQEKANFVDAFEQFSTTVGQAAVDEVLRIREAARSFTETLQATAELTNTTWPYYDYYHGLNAFASEQVSAKNMESIGYLTRVRHDQREAYLDFQRTRHEEWVQAGHMDAYGNMDRLFPDLYQDDILGFNNTDFSVTPSPDRDEYYPLAYRFPPPNSYFIVNFDISSINYDDLFASLLSMGNQTLLSNINPYIDGDDAEKEYHAQFHDRLPGDRSDSSFPHSFLFHPVHGPSSNDGAKPPIVAVVTYPIAWDASLRRLLPDQVKGIIAVARNNCNQAVTYEIVGQNAYFMEWDDVHDPKYDHLEHVVNLDFSDHPRMHETPGHCVYKLSIYPSARFEDAYKSSTPTLYVVVVGCTFALMIIVFFVYDGVVERRNRKIIRDAARSNEIVTSMFPGGLRDKIMKQKMAKGSSNKSWNKKSKQLASMLETQHGTASLRQILTVADSEPLAEHHTDTTIMFADIVGFTKWSSTREPAQVFTLLETLYRAMDALARQRKIFKVETVGDCYVAIAGFPDKQDDHASRMCRFGAQCLKTFSRVLSILADTTLPGQDTATLELRVGIHSGPVTAGVLRGDRSRIQLFGNTMNTTSRVETCGVGGKVHVSKATADLLVAEGCASWILRREDTVHAKGLGVLQTYFLKTSTSKRPCSTTVEPTTADEKQECPPVPETENLVVEKCRADEDGPRVEEQEGNVSLIEKGRRWLRLTEEEVPVVGFVPNDFDDGSGLSV